jgi:hypothetical protein
MRMAWQMDSGSWSLEFGNGDSAVFACRIAVGLLRRPGTLSIALYRIVTEYHNQRLNIGGSRTTQPT